MITRSSNIERLHLILFRNTAKIWPESVSHIRSQKRLAIFRAPNTMNEATSERMHAAYFCRPFRDSKRLYHQSHSVKTLGYCQRQVCDYEGRAPAYENFGVTR